VNRGRNDFAEFSVWNRRQVVWLHGRAEQYTDRNLEEEVAHLDEALVSLLRPLLNDSPLVVIGYRGAEPSIDNGRPPGGRSPAQPELQKWDLLVHVAASIASSQCRAARASAWREFSSLEIEGFDELMSELAPQRNSRRR
jgi:hypothetical protein